MKIIKKGKKIPVSKMKECHYCGCVFEYDDFDIEIDRDGIYVKCPQCGKFIAVD